jgi:hypothetical protein
MTNFRRHLLQVLDLTLYRVSNLDRLVYVVPTSTMASTTLAEICRLDLPYLSTPPLASITETTSVNSFHLSTPARL